MWWAAIAALAHLVLLGCALMALAWNANSPNVETWVRSAAAGPLVSLSSFVVLDLLIGWAGGTDDSAWLCMASELPNDYGVKLIAGIRTAAQTLVSSCDAPSHPAFDPRCGQLPSFPR